MVEALGPWCFAVLAARDTRFRKAHLDPGSGSGCFLLSACHAYTLPSSLSELTFQEHRQLPLNQLSGYGPLQKDLQDTLSLQMTMVKNVFCYGRGKNQLQTASGGGNE